MLPTQLKSVCKQVKTEEKGINKLINKLDE